MPKYSNKLIGETSPYLLQHAHNPVNWYPWSDEALDKAIEEDKPILVSIGYSACHWCHVMERESFEDESTAALMNEHFINIKIDREERPDLDHIYMDAVQALSGSGGWPLNIFLMPNRKPFYGGTYFPPARAFNRPSWKEVLELVFTAFKNKRHELEAQSETLTAHLVESNAFGFQKVNEEEVFTAENTNIIYGEIMRSADKQWGGFGKAPKFPQTFSILYLLRYQYEKSKEKNTATGEINYAEQALFSLDKMIEGGIYDQLGGGFARYATDVEWLIPHFEKMLYDNALLIAVLSEAYQLTGRKRYEEVIHETMAFISRELLHDGKAFYAALDADSEGVEGKFYVWEEKEVKDILGADAALFNEYFDVTRNGNWNDPHLKTGEGGINILRVKEPAALFIKRKNISLEILDDVIEKGKKKLLASRNKRIRPQLDDKIILGWNALMNTACCKAFAATGKPGYRDLAIANMNFLLEKFKNPEGPGLFHTWKNGQAKYPAFLDDYAFLVQALLHLQEVTGEVNWLIKAGEITGFVIENFSEESGFFYYTKADQADVIVQKKEVYDGAVPSGNAVMAANLYKLSILLDKKEWKERSIAMISALGKAITRYPTSFGNWAVLLLEICAGTNEIVLTGKDLSQIHKEILHAYIPHRVLMLSSNANKNFTLLADKPMTNPPSIWLCRNFSCHPPLTAVRELIALINSRETQ